MNENRFYLVEKDVLPKDKQIIINLFKKIIKESVSIKKKAIRYKHLVDLICFNCGKIYCKSRCDTFLSTTRGTNDAKLGFRKSRTTSCSRSCGGHVQKRLKKFSNKDVSLIMKSCFIRKYKKEY